METLVEVTQADRDAATEAASALEIEWAGRDGYFAQILAQAFARHRLDAERLSSPTEMREALAKATVISAYSISDPLAVRIVFGSDEDRAAFADAIDAVLSDG